jgi:hypothetical protein
MKKIFIALADAVRETPAFMLRQLWLGQGPEWAYAFFPTWISFELLFLADRIQPQYHQIAHDGLLYSGLGFVAWISISVLSTAISRYDQFRGIVDQYNALTREGLQPQEWMVREYQRIS